MTTAFAPQEKLLFQVERLAAFQRDDISVSPALVEIAPTNHCNAKCPWCFYVASEYKQKHSREEINADVLKRALAEMASMGVPAITWTGGGDPSVYSHIDDLIDVAHSLGLRQGMFTNAYRRLRAPEKLDWIRVTVTEIHTLTRNVWVYAQATKTGVNFNLCEANQHELRDMLDQARLRGVAYFQIRPALADRAELQQPVEMPLWAKEFQTDTMQVVLTPYKFEDHARPHGYQFCHGHRFVPFIWHNGDLAVCAYHFGQAEYTFGNLNEHSFAEIWRSERRRAMLDAGIDVIPACQHCCKNHEINKVLAASRGEYPKPDDVAFI